MQYLSSSELKDDVPSPIQKQIGVIMGGGRVQNRIGASECVRPQSKNEVIILGIISLSLLLWAFYSEVEPGRGGGGAAGGATGSSRLRHSWRRSQGIEVEAQLEAELGCVGRGAAGSGAGVSSFWH